MGIREITDKFTDPYDRPARLYPALIALSPFSVLFVCLYGQSLVWGASTVIVSCGGAFLLSRIARDAGKRLQEKLFEEWGGAPSTQLLRHSDKRIDVHTKERFHNILSKGVGKKLPTSAEEAADSRAADELYRAATVWLISQTRDVKMFPLVFKENVAFGFQRNALGLRTMGIGLAVLAAIWVLLHEWARVSSVTVTAQVLIASVSAPALASLAYSIFILLAWLSILNEAALKRTGFSYAERLLQSLDSIKTPARRQAATKKPEKGT